MSNDAFAPKYGNWFNELNTSNKFVFKLSRGMKFALFQIASKQARNKNISNRSTLTTQLAQF